MDVAINYTIKSIAEIIKGKIIQHNSNAEPTHLLLDSRKLIFPDTTIFFALNNSHQKGSAFIQNLYKENVRCFVIDEKSFDISLYKDANFILVKNVLQALQAFAAFHRHSFTLPVIGITGSNGKTIVKEWLNQLLEKDFTIVRNPKSYNSQIGVPLSVLQIHTLHTLAIFEAGISQPGEMKKLEKVIHPSIGIFTNIGEAHSEGFSSKRQKIKEKLALFQFSSLLVYKVDDKELDEEINNLKLINPGLKLFRWGEKDDLTLQVISIKKEKNISLISAVYFYKEIQIQINFTDEASVENAISCWCILLYMGISNEIIAERMLQLHSVEMRLELKQGINNCSIINDSYSADVNSLKIGLDFLQQQKQHTKKTIFLSDILQTGKREEELYREVAFLLKQKNIQRLVAIGPKINLQQQQFSFLKEKHFFVSVDDFTSHFHTLQFKDETILIKGARIFEFEQIGKLLEQKSHGTILSINLNAIAYNLKQYQQSLQPGVKIMAMVKAFSYGSGSYEIANLLQFSNVSYLAVAYADEGIELRKAGITLPIMVMNPEENTFNALIQYNLEPEIFSFTILSAFENYLNDLALQYFPVHIKLDTGMHRLGFVKEDFNALAEHLTLNNKIKIQSVFSHLAASDNKGSDGFTQRQVEIFKNGCDVLQKVLHYPFLKHIANTSAITRLPELQMDMVRLGIGLYGIDANSKMQKKLKNVSTLTTTIAQIKNVSAGESVGYGSEGVLKSDAVIATVRIGYADGYPRQLSNGIGKMLLKNKMVPVAGKVCMDMTMLNVTGVNCKEGDSVLVFGNELPVTEVANWCHTIPYEILTGISQRVKRIYFEE